MIKQAIAKVVNGQNLMEEEMVSTMDEIMTGRTTSSQIGAFLTALAHERRNRGGNHRGRQGHA